MKCPYRTVEIEKSSIIGKQVQDDNDNNVREKRNIVVTREFQECYEEDCACFNKETRRCERR